MDFNLEYEPKKIKMRKILSLLIIPLMLFSCGGPSEVDIKDCDAYGGVIRYNDELYTGKVKKYFDDGKVEWDFDVIDGVKNGDRIEYRRDGSKQVTVYDMGTVTGIKYFDKDGNLTGESVFNKDGTLKTDTK